MDIAANVGAEVPKTVVTVGAAEIVSDTTKTPESAAKKAADLLAKPGVQVSEKGVAQMLLDAQYQTAKNTIDNLVDSPEERREKEERRLEEEEAADLKAQAEARSDRNAALRASDPQSVSFI